MNYTLPEIATIVSGTLFAPGKTHLPVTGIITDSRVDAVTSQVLFVALKGENFDAHHFVPNVYRKGVWYFLLEQMPETRYPDAAYILVENTLAALQQLAAYHRKQAKIPVVGITGSNGKTVVKEWLYQVLHKKFNVCRSPKSYNSQVGVPLSVLQLEASHQIAVFEAGISEPGEMERLQKIIQPTIGILTNIGDAHQVNFASKIDKLREKLKLFSTAGVLLFHQDEIVSRTFLAEQLPGVKLLSIASENQTKNEIPDFTYRIEQQKLVLRYASETYNFSLPFSDSVSIKNIVQIIALILYKGWLSPGEINKNLQELSPVSMRMELLKGQNGLTIINDAYNYDLTGLEHALNFAWKNRQNKPLSVILSDFVHHYENNEKNARRIARIINKFKIKRLIIIGEKLKNFREIFATNNVAFFDSVSRFLQSPEWKTLSNETVLVKGARTFRFEQIIRRLQSQTHSTRLEINISALRHNFQTFKALLNPGTKVMVMVKAFAYGAGADEMSHLLESLNADYLGVAYTDEGIRLRQAGVQLPIMVMNPEPETFDVLIQHRLEPEIYSIRILNLFLQTLERSVQAVSTPYPIHLKLDTGMHRLGFEAHQINDLLELLRQNQDKIKVTSIFSHLTSTDNPYHDQWTEQQIVCFETMSNRILQQLSYRPLRHILNSNGISRFGQYQYDMVRLGIGLFGLISDKHLAGKLQSVCSLITSVSQLKTIKKDETVGYNRQGKTSRNTTVATLAIGYADGLHRVLSQSDVSFYVHNFPVKIIGNICMDMTMVDVTGIDEVKEGDAVIIFNRNEQLETLARQARTIPYEILTAIPQRVKRVYVNE